MSHKGQYRSGSQPATFGERMRLVRESLGYSRRELAQLSRVSEGTIKFIERARFGAGRYRALRVLLLVARTDPDAARWIATGSEAPSQLLEELEKFLSPSSPIVFASLHVSYSPKKQVRLLIDWSQAAKLLKFVEAQGPQCDADGVPLLISIDGRDS